MWNDLLGDESPKAKRKLYITIGVLVIILLLIPLGVYLVRQTQVFKPKATDEQATVPENSFTLNPLSDVMTLTPNQEFSVEVLAKSDFDKVSLFRATLSFPKDLLEVVNIETPEATPSGGTMCGGIAGIECLIGLSCDLNEPTNQPDQAGTCHVSEGGYCQGGETCARGLSCQTVVVGDTATMQCKPNPSASPSSCPQVTVHACHNRSTCNSDHTACTDIAPECADYPSICDVPSDWYVDASASGNEEGGVNEGSNCEAGAIQACSNTDPQVCRDFQNTCDIPEGWTVVQNNSSIGNLDSAHANFDNSTGEINMFATSQAGVKTNAGAPLLLAKINFKTKQPGSGVVSFGSPVGMLRTSDNVDVLQNKHDLNFVIANPSSPLGSATASPSVQASASPHASSSPSPQASASVACVGGSQCTSPLPSASSFAGVCHSNSECAGNQYCQFVAKECPEGQFCSTVASGYCLANNNGKGDANSDGFIDLTDLSILYSNFFKDQPRLDFNSDGLVNSVDYAYMISALRSLKQIK